MSLNLNPEQNGRLIHSGMDAVKSAHDACYVDLHGSAGPGPSQHLPFAFRVTQKCILLLTNKEPQWSVYTSD